MFDHKHYVPILRWKGGERAALQKLDPVDKAKMTPLLELIPVDFVPKKRDDPIDIDGVLRKKAEELNKYWGDALLFLDLRHLDQFNPTPLSSKGTHPLEFLNRELYSNQLTFLPSRASFIPVTGLNRSADYQAAVATIAKADRRGACIRLCLDDIQRPSFQNNLEHLLSYLGLRPEEVDLLVDYQVIENSSPSYVSVCNRLPNLQRWRTFTISSGAFPVNLSGFEKNSQHELPRLDWLTWRNQVLQSLPRRPSYSDYTIQHGIYSEPPRGANFSASIRYTTEEFWVIMRGEGVRNEDGPGYEGYLGNAMLLTDRAEFCGADFSYGDKYIKGMSLQSEKTGSAQTWIQAGINHHLTFVVRQIASLFGSSTGSAL